MPDTAPLVQVFEAAVPAAAQAADSETAICEVPFDGTITKAEYVPAAAIVGANTDTRKVAVRNKGQAGAGTTDAASVQFNSGVNGTAFDAKALTLSGTPADLVVATGDELSCKSTHVGAGLADPGGRIHVEITRS